MKVKVKVEYECTKCKKRFDSPNLVNCGCKEKLGTYITPYEIKPIPKIEPEPTPEPKQIEKKIDPPKKKFD